MSKAGENRSPRLELKMKIKKTKRRCLCCDHAFDSEGPHNRMCVPCKRYPRHGTVFLNVYLGR